jgi:hypothetical protein
VTAGELNRQGNSEWASAGGRPQRTCRLGRSLSKVACLCTGGGGVPQRLPTGRRGGDSGRRDQHASGGLASNEVWGQGGGTEANGRAWGSLSGCGGLGFPVAACTGEAGAWHRIRERF